MTDYLGFMVGASRVLALQRDADVRVWGTATPGTDVTVTFAGQVKHDIDVVEGLGGWGTRLGLPGHGRDISKPIPADGKCTVCGGTEFKRRADDNEDSLRTRLMAYYKQTSPLIGYYYAKGDLTSVDGLGEIDAVKAEISAALDG